MGARGSSARGGGGLHVEYAGGRINYGILFIFRLFYEYSNLEYVHIHGIYRVDQAESDIRILVAESQKYVNTHSKRRGGEGKGRACESVQRPRAPRAALSVLFCARCTLCDTVCGLRVGLYTILPSPILYGVCHTQGGSGRGSYIPQ